MSEIERGILRKLGTEMLLVGFLSLAFTGILYVGIFNLVAAEYAQLAEGEEPGNEEAGDALSQTNSSTTVANTSANTNTGVLRNGTNRRILRTRRHGGGETIVSFAVDLENNNHEASRPVVVGCQACRGRKVLHFTFKILLKFFNLLIFRNKIRHIQATRCSKTKAQSKNQIRSDTIT